MFLCILTSVLFALLPSQWTESVLQIFQETQSQKHSNLWTQVQSNHSSTSTHIHTHTHTGKLVAVLLMTELHLKQQLHALPSLLVGRHQLAFNSLSLSRNKKINKIEQRRCRNVPPKCNLCTIKQQVINASSVSSKVCWVNWVQIRTCGPCPVLSTQ